MSHKKHKIVMRFHALNLSLLVISLILVGSVVFIILKDMTNDASRSYARFYSLETVGNFELYIQKDLDLVEKVARSKALTDWFADEDNQEKKAAAYAKIMDYADLLVSAYMYIGIHKSMNEYALSSGTALSEFSHYDVMNSRAESDSWYFDCIASKNKYNLNIDTDKASLRRRLWINHKVMDGDKVLGVFSSGLQFDRVIKNLFGRYDTDDVSEFVIDRKGVIRMDSALSLDKNQYDSGRGYHIFEADSDPAFVTAVTPYLDDSGAFFTPQKEPEVIRLSRGSSRYVSIVPIPNTDWMVITFFNSNSLYNMTRLLPLLIAMLSAFLLYAAATSLLMRRLVLLPLNRLIDSVSASGTDNGTGNIHGSDKNNEFGDLARTIQSMRDRMHSYNAEILRASAEKNRQGMLLHAVNGAAVTLLAAEDEKFEASLRKGMELMARCMDIDRIHIWKNEMKNGVLHYIQKFEWLGEHGRSENFVPAETAFSYSETFPEWERKFSRKKYVNGPLSSLSPVEQERLGPYGVQSILVIPVSIQDKFWGFVSFDDCHQERTFTEDEVNILRSGSLMLVSAMNRNETAARMREADERTRIMLDATPLCCNMWNKDFCNIDCNEEAVKLFGLKSKREYLSRFFDLSPEFQPDGQRSPDKASDYIREAFVSGRVVFEWMHQMLDGTPIPSEITLVRVRHGEEYIIAGYTRDLRQYKKMMRELEHKDALLHMVNDVASILLQSSVDEFDRDLRRCMGMMAGSVGADRVHLWKNRVKDGRLCCTQLYEWSEKGERQRGTELTVDIPYSENLPGWEKTLSSGQCVNNLARDVPPGERAQLPSQGILPILAIPVFLRGDFWGFVGFDDCHNEWLPTKAEESILRSGSLLIANALLRNEMTAGIRSEAAKMEAVISNYSGVIWSVDSNNVITLFNGLYLQEMGTTPSYIEGKSLEVASRMGRHFDIIANGQKTFEEGSQDWVSEVDGKMFHAHTMPIYDGNGGVIGVVGSFDDITDTVRLQRELEEAVTKAQMASRAKSDFLSNMSHEMRTPMNAIIGMTMIGKRAADMGRKDDAFEKIENASSHLLGVINDILDMAKIEANKFELSEVEFSFEKMLQKVVNVLNFRIDERQQHFMVYIDKDIPPGLIGDDLRIAQVITNLLSNAVKFTPEHGSIRLEVRFVKEQGGVCTIQTEVTDTGIGVSKEQQASLFTSFEQAENSTSRKYGGTGLGLAISKHIVGLMGGSLWVESELGAGATFAFTVKLRRGAEKHGSLLNSGVNWKNIRALAMDDDPETQKYFASIAERFKIRCDTTADRVETVRMIDSHGPYDIYFLGWNVQEGMDGIELSRLIKARSDSRSVIIMVTPGEWNIIGDEAKAAGVDYFLPKPLFPSAIADCINKCIGAAEAVSGVTVPVNLESFKGRRILLAEDVEINREIVLSLLEPMELEIDCAWNGEEAVSMFSNAPDRYDVIFMDMQMPEMDGLEATQRIRDLDLPGARTIPIVAMTANVFREDIEKCLEAGMNKHVGKPLDFDEVLRVLREYLSPEVSGQ